MFFNNNTEGKVLVVLLMTVLLAEGGKCDALSSGMKLVSKVWDQCSSQEDLFVCLKMKGLRFMSRALETNEIPLLQGLTLVRSSYPEADARELSEKEVDDPKKINEILFDRVARFFNEYSVEFNTRENGVARLIEEGRGKLKKLAGPLLISIMIKASMLGLAFMMVTALAGKALIVAKIALTLASVIGIKKLFNQPAEKVTYEIVKAPPHVVHTSASPHMGWESSGMLGGGGGGGGGYEAGGMGGLGGRYRSFKVGGEKEYAQMLAYGGQGPHVQHVVLPGTTGTTQILVGA